VIEGMPRPRPPHLHHERTRHGKTVWYVRVGKGLRKRLRSTYGSPEFKAEYQAVLRGETPHNVRSKAVAGTLSWLLERYRETTAWTALSMATRRQRENIFRQVIASAGHVPCGQIRRDDIVAGRDRRAATPYQARHFLNAMRGLFCWALEAQHVKVDPTATVKNPSRRKGDGFPPWTEDDIARYEARWPIGTKERVWLDVLQYTGLRRGDAVRLGRQHVRDGVLTLRTEKSGKTVGLTLPILPVLAATLAAGPCGDLAFICGSKGEPLTKESFGNVFRGAARAAGVNKSAHGVRKIGATRAAENGATVAELEAIFGWQGGGMAALYTKAANRARLSRAAMTKLERTADERSIPAPDPKVRASSKKPYNNQSDKN
jgi:integrase